MKKIKLTNKQIIKLCEMCDKLFDHTLSIQEFQGFTYIEVEGTGEEIHWFEFCMTHLVEKIFESIPEDDELFYDRYINNGATFYGVGVNEILYVMRNENKHPVDYLYSEFLKLSK